MERPTRTSTPFRILGGIAVCAVILWFCPLTHIVLGRINLATLDSVPVLPNAYDEGQGAQFVYDGWHKSYRVDLGAEETLQQYEQALRQAGWSFHVQNYVSSDGTRQTCLRANKIILSADISIITLAENGNAGEKSVVSIYIPPAISACDRN